MGRKCNSHWPAKNRKYMAGSIETCHECLTPDLAPTCSINMIPHPCVLLQLSTDYGEIVLFGSRGGHNEQNFYFVLCSMLFFSIGLQLDHRILMAVPIWIGLFWVPGLQWHAATLCIRGFYQSFSNGSLQVMDDTHVCNIPQPPMGLPDWLRTPGSPWLKAVSPSLLLPYGVGYQNASEWQRHYHWDTLNLS